MKINRLFSIAAAALMMVACSSEDTALKNTPAAGPQMQFTATIAAPGSGATTRTAYTESGTDINVTWSVGDEIALVHDGVKDVATVKTINSDGSATINGIVTGATNEADVQLYYPAALVKSVTNDGPVFDNDLWGRISTQDGTLKYIQDNLDFRSAKGQLSVNETSATLKEAATMNSMHAIWKLTLQDDAETPAALSAKKVSVQLTADVPILRASTAELTTATSTFYLAMEPFTDAPITIEATVGDDTYKYEKKSVSIASGKYYQSTVNMTMVKTIDLSELQGDCEAKNGYTLTGTLAGNYKITIANGATVTLDNANINSSRTWAGITCLGDVTIILKDGTTNTVSGSHEDYPGIFVPKDKTLTIKGETEGTGKLSTSGNCGAGIGGGYGMESGNIVIQGGDITAMGGNDAAGIGAASYGTCGDITISGGTIKATTGGGADGGAGIGSGSDSSCGNITITGGSIEATGGKNAAGIGSGQNSSCGNITINDGVTKVTAEKGTNAPNSIGAGKSSTCGTVTIGGTEYASGISQSPYEYPLPALSLTSPTVGQVIGSDGKNYAANATLPTGVTKVAMIAYVSGSNGLAIALADEGKMQWAVAKTPCEAKTPAFTNGTWKLPTKDDWTNMFSANGGSNSSYSGLNDALATAGGNGSKLRENEAYWSSTPYSDAEAYFVYLSSPNITLDHMAKIFSFYVRAVLEF